MVQDARERMRHLIAEYRKWRKLADELDALGNAIEERLLELERLLPDEGAFPNDRFAPGERPECSG